MILPPQFDPTRSRTTWYEAWQSAGVFASEPSAKAPYSILMPPPNVTGILHFGHVLNHTIQDLYIRWHSMLGDETCWFPGLDHAGIATQTKVEQQLREQGTNRHELGRDVFVERVWDWKNKYGNIILEQLKMLGNSCDWNTTLFTMDETASNAVRDVFIALFDEGLIYRGKRIINWSPLAMSALSDEEVVHKEVREQIYSLRYHLADGSGTLIVATVRPETIFADVAVAVHPDDERYNALAGQEVIVPLSGKRIPIILDDYVDMSFGTGCLKVTPAHDPNDYEIGIRHGLDMPQCIDADATLNQLAGDYAGLERFKARRVVVRDLEARQLLEKTEPYTHNIGYSERGGEPVEPYLSDQWFVKMAPLAKPALKAVQNREIRFYPEHWTKTYEHWMMNIRDWCISRQLWWGHRIPVYYATDGRYTAARNEDEARSKLGLPASEPLIQDPDVLDTWFSSWLWPLTTQRWQVGEQPTVGMQYYLPTNLLVTGPDIIFFWVARMIMATLKFGNTIPFKDVYFTSIIRDSKGRKLSKSRGNSPDPIAILDKYGSDAVRFTMIYLAPLGTDVRLEIDEKTQDIPSMEIGRNFANKVWNACRFLLLKKEEVGVNISKSVETSVTAADRWILSRYHSTLYDASKALEQYRITEYSKILYEFIWRDYCDWYVEIVKIRCAQAHNNDDKAAALQTAFSVMEGTLKLLHPVMPFLTEDLWQSLFTDKPGETFILQAGFPAFDANQVDHALEDSFTTLQSVVETVRRQRNELSIPPSTRLPVVLGAEPGVAAFLTDHQTVVSNLVRASQVTIGTDIAKPPASVSEIVRGVECYLIVEGAIDTEKEIDKLRKELTRLTNAIAGVEKKLMNEGFIKGASPEVVAAEKKKHADWSAAKEKVERNLASL
ncbi:MAG: valine--tRNA ligase [Chlorobi bacterium]|nr:MAG: valine--tRNA ligase [Bacteroidota bacterium]MBE2264903.1 valine--tRNA ligase [Flavobacteriales bacterium]MBL1160801.1 valine--tRNA ligase [Chlorobiota bacterium]MBW7853152.1 valine--tRNA ligase [Candidatus Kapabacteria bacterium]MCC6331359.1 valine--tRNA ligase [Ignavibacteria bacterium]